MNEQELSNLLFSMQGQIDDLTAQLDELRVKGLNDLVSGTGNQRFGQVMQLNQDGILIRGNSLLGAFYFVDTFTGFSTATAYSRISGYVLGDASKIQLDAFRNSASDASISLYANEFGPSTIDVVAGDGGFVVTESAGVAKPFMSLSDIGNTLLELGAFSSDPGNAYDGFIFYRSDTNRFRVMANSIARNLTMDGTNTTLTIATGVVTATTSFHAIDTESAAATDDLDTINGGQTGQVLHIHAANGARDVVAKDGTGNLKLAGDFTMNNTEDVLTLIYDGTNWLEMCRSDNGA